MKRTVMRDLQAVSILLPYHKIEIESILAWGKQYQLMTMAPEATRIHLSEGIYGKQLDYNCTP